MRISDWISDVCSSDRCTTLRCFLSAFAARSRVRGAAVRRWKRKWVSAWSRPCLRRAGVASRTDRDAGEQDGDSLGRAFFLWQAVQLDRKSVETGKSVSVRVDLGGCRIIKKKKS